MLEIKGLHACYEGSEILKGVDLSIGMGEVHVVMGPNGAGKSTLTKVLSGDPSVAILSGEIVFRGEELSEDSPEKRAQKGLFIGFQQPPEISGVVNEFFLREAFNALSEVRGEERLSAEQFRKVLQDVQTRYGFYPDDSLMTRCVNEGFSGGERKKNEVLQMLVLQPTLAILDEPDSGLDVDALYSVCAALNRYIEHHPESSICVVTHNPKMVSMLKPSHIHVFSRGEIAISGDLSLVEKIEKGGYGSLLAGCESGNG